jgi:hypothetical protein
VFKPAAPFALLCLLASPWLPAPVDVFLSLATFLTCMSQQFHAWAHMKRSELPPAVDRLQASSTSFTGGSPLPAQCSFTVWAVMKPPSQQGIVNCSSRVVLRPGVPDLAACARTLPR